MKSKKTLKDRYILAKNFFRILKNKDIEHSNLFHMCIVSLRNPIVFDNDIVDLKTTIPFIIDFDNNGKKTQDHLLGSSNIVAFLFKYDILEKCDEIGFADIFKLLNVQITIPKSLNDKKTFKDWTFNDCLKWNEKLKKEGFIIAKNKKGDEIKIDDIHIEWYKNLLETLKKYNIEI
jgi:hypothetical protein